MGTLENIASDRAAPAHALDGHFATVYRMPMLSESEERELTLSFRNGRDWDAAQTLVLSHLRLVVAIARGYLGYGLPFADLVQEGSIGLMVAVNRFDPDCGVRLAGYAVHHIRGAMQEFILKNWRVVRIATTKAQRRLFFNLRSLKQQLETSKHEEVERIAEALEVRPEEVVAMEARFASPELSLVSYSGKPERGADEMSILDIESGDADPCEALETREAATALVALEKGLERLDSRSLDILTERWLREERTTLEVLAARYGVSKERIRQIESRALSMLHTHLLAQGVAPAI